MLGFTPARRDHKNRSVSVHDFAMVPRADIPRSSFNRQSAHKTTIDASYLIPVFLDEVLPGDTFNFQMTVFARMATPVFPVMDNLMLDSFFFFVPNRLVWTHWVNFMGEQDSPTDSISFSIPQIVSPVGGYAIGSLYDYFGLPTVGQIGGGEQVTHSALPLRAYNLIFNDWFRDENLVDSVPNAAASDGPDNYTGFNLVQRGKRHDYFTSCLPWTQKGGVAVTLPLGGSAPVIPSPLNGSPKFVDSGSHALGNLNIGAGLTTPITFSTAATDTGAVGWDASANGTGLIADLSNATASTINQIRQAFQIQRLLERDARGGSRYTEIVRSHFGVMSPDARLQRPEYLGGGSSPVNIGSVPQTSATGLTGGSTPQGNLSAFGTVVAPNHGFSYSSTEHGHIIGIVMVRADLSYDRGLRRLWSRLTRYDFYFPVFAMLGEQAVLNQEIFASDNTLAAGTQPSTQVFAYQERWAEYRYFPSLITGLFRTTAAGTLDSWHLCQSFTSLPTLNAAFISENVPMARVLAAGSLANNQQFLCDFFFQIRTARPMPMYSVPGLIDHF